MKHYLSIFLILSCFLATAQSSEVMMDAKDLPLEDIIRHLEQENEYLFSFKTTDIQDIRISIQAKNMDIHTFLEKVFVANGLEAEIVSDNYILLTKAPEKEKLLPLLSGRVIDKLTGEGLAYANVYLKKTRRGTTTQNDGGFQFRAEFEQTDSVVISYVGYQEMVRPVTDFTARKSSIVQLQFYEFGEDFIIVTDYMTDGIDLGEKGASTIIRPAKMSAMPGQAEPDVLHSLQFLPGISSPDEQASDIYIRGGTPDQNLILWEDIPIYHSAHYFNLISAFNPYIMDKVKVYRSGFSAIHGGRISGVLDLKSDDYHLKKSNFGLGTNLTHAYAYGKSKVLNDKVALIFSIRRSFREWWESPTFNNLTRRNLQGVIFENEDIDHLPKHVSIKTDFSFFDANLKASIRMTDQDEVSAAWLYGVNNFDNQLLDEGMGLEQEDHLDLNNQGASLSWRHDWGQGFSSKITGTRSYLFYDYGYSFIRDGNMIPDKIGKKRNEITENKLLLDNTYTSSQQHEFKLGYHYTKNQVSYELTQEAEESPQAKEENNYEANLHAMYGEYQSPENLPLSVQAGIRLNYYQGTQKMYVEPRLRLAYQLSNNWIFHANAGQYHQFMSRLIEFKTDDVGIDNPIWILAGAKDVLNINREIPVLQARQYQLGLVFDKKSWVIDVQAYYKKISGLTSLSIGFEDIPKEEYDRGISTIQGIDFLIKKRWKSYRTWVSYTLSKVDYSFPKFSRETFDASYDQRHVLHWAHMYKIGNLELSLGWKLASGKPYTKIIDHRPGGQNMGMVRPIYGSFNVEKLPLQHHLDASVSYHFTTKSSLKGVLGLSFFNIYNQDNVYNRRYFLKLEPNHPPEIRYRDKGTLGFTPNAVLRVEW